MSNNLPKKEKIKSKKLIELLFTIGSSEKKFPIRMIYLPLVNSSASTHMVAFSVPKRRVKKAVDRNRIKRQMREAYRLNKFSNLEQDTKKIAVMFIYIGPNPSDYNSITKAFVHLKNRIYTSFTDGV